MSPILVVIALVFHLFPFRTEKLSPTAPMVRRKRESRSPPSFQSPRPFSGHPGRDAFWLAAAGTAVALISNVLSLLCSSREGTLFYVQALSGASPSFIRALSSFIRAPQVFPCSKQAFKERAEGPAGA